MAGALYAPLIGTAHPSMFGIAFTIQAFVWVAVGGQGTLIGPLLAAIALKLLENQLRGISADGYVMVMAALFMLAVIFLPQGIAGLFARVASESRGRWEPRRPVRPESPSSPALLPVRGEKGALTSDAVANHEPLAPRTGRLPPPVKGGSGGRRVGVRGVGEEGFHG